MDISKLKGRASYPFETIATAISFSPRLEAVLAESKRLVDSLNAHFLLFHIGTKTEAKEEQLDTLMKRLDISKAKTRVIWMEGDPVDTILKLSKLNVVDLLILGALERENILKFYLGSVARSISRKAKCSVLLLTQPLIQGKKYKKFVVNGIDNPKTVHTINTAVYLAERLNVKDMTIVRETHTPGLAMTIAESSTAPEAQKIKKDILEKESGKLHSIVDMCDTNNINITEKTITGKPGFAIRNYSESKRADLLVINSPDTNLNILDRIFTHDIEYILEDLPCNLLIVHSRV